jgi:hypothetical protein
VRAARLLTRLVSACWLAGCGSPHVVSSPSERAESSSAVVLLRPLDSCTPSGPETCENALDDNCNGVIDEGCDERMGLVQFVIAWDKPGADVDLRVTDPNGELVEVGRPAESGLLKERDCPGRGGECRGKNTENVFLESGEPVRGTYVVKVRLESLGGETTPIPVRFGARLGPKTYAAELVLERPEAERELSLKL